MTPALLLGIGALGGIGALARFLVADAIAYHARAPVEIATVAVNLAGALALGLLAGLAVADDVYRLAATGFLGAYTTFSGWMLDSRRLPRPFAAVNLGASLVLGVLAAWAGRKLGMTL